MTSAVADKERKRRDAYLKRTYGLCLEDYERILHEQGGGCAICGKTAEQDNRHLAVDHVHTGEDAGAVRGILCWSCNRFVVGRHRRDVGSHVLLRAAATYLDRDYHPFFAPPKKRKRKKRAKKQT